MITIKENKKTKKKLKEEDKKLTYEILKELNIGDTLSNEENIEKEEIKVNRKKILFLRKEFVYLFLVLFVIFGGYSGARILLWSNDARSTEKQIEKINKTNIGNQETKIIVYENSGKTIRTAIQGKDYEINFDYINTQDEKNIELIVKKDEIERKWYIIDAANKPLGRVAAEAAKLLRGKHKPTYTPNMDAGDHVIIINCSEVVLTGHKLTQKIYRHHSSYIGGMKEIQAKDMLANNPEKMMTLAVTGMLPHNSLGRQMAKKLRVYAGAEHENMAQKPEIWNF